MRDERHDRARYRDHHRLKQLEWIAFAKCPGLVMFSPDMCANERSVLLFFPDMYANERCFWRQEGIVGNTTLGAKPSAPYAGIRGRNESAAHRCLSGSLNRRST